MKAASRQAYNLAAERAFGLCEICGRAAAEQMHHRLHRSHGGGESPSNLLHTCHVCHAKAHQDTHRYGNGWALRSGIGTEHDPVNRRVLYRGRWVLLTADGGLVEQEVTF